ncbi:MAG: hypothetical protein QW507_02190 [Candidatus Nanoarchaeia archaeon]|nr:hypothetical protein [Candidatus Haiyanarchaeum thermophilum]MCW1302778.1 hypothetical protein [Candidatus Haiyanarchaeum thermophilum]MCW1304124.1 hypothetical protein [Candidatus Haiyanarchaeum thermophilum]MCW1306639.1 hypothetical protein [Candidatus Haiyanarchaeum thermophilum]MCW1307405.1 hypothetical protein [Candidatus Haiyanarchaeum thermophilum]
MKIRVKYATMELAKHFKASDMEEVLELKKGSTYEDLLDLLLRKCAADSKERVLSSFLFLIDGKPITLLMKRKVDPAKPVVIVYADFGG